MDSCTSSIDESTENCMHSHSRLKQAGSGINERKMHALYLAPLPPLHPKAWRQHSMAQGEQESARQKVMPTLQGNGKRPDLLLS
ncbi:hypothetical protein NDU88_004682 [Pleurodeles waltl]|uniref:Uncharacterized protein n=1 Tax=Pleurodeles waltl TaxID=8319 RepID=A0AAV7T868_PLEWA|nr:hypothetical protein NDU88_004682 [Pleurodeles waltl]